VSRKSKASVQLANQQRHALMASAVLARHVRPTVAPSAAKAVVLRPVVVAIAVLRQVVVKRVVIRVAVRQWQTVRPTPSARPRHRRRNAQASFWSTRTRHRASVAAHQPVRASVRALVVASRSEAALSFKLQAASKKRQPSGWRFFLSG
jgi:hypothetical protein